MSHNNAKSILQEFYQSKNQKIPEYLKIFEGGPSHKPNWKACVTLASGHIFYSETCTTVKEAEQSAAKIAWDAIQSELTNKSKPKTNDKLMNNKNKTVLIVDIENLHNFIFELEQDKIDLYTVYVFISKNHHLINKHLPDGVIKVVVNSDKSDAVDTCIQMYIGAWLSNNKFDQYIIATKDHFGSTLVDIINNTNELWEGKPAKVVIDTNL